MPNKNQIKEWAREVYLEEKEKEKASKPKKEPKK